MKMTYKSIDRPSEIIRTLLLLPALVVLIILFILKPDPSYPLWAIIIGAASILSYLGVMTYFCIKQKCYVQLARTYITISLALAAFLMIRYSN